MAPMTTMTSMMMMVVNTITVHQNVEVVNTIRDQCMFLMCCSRSSRLAPEVVDFALGKLQLLYLEATPPL